MGNNIFGIIVTYNPQIQDLQTLIDSMSHQVDTIIIVDNGSSIDFNEIDQPDNLIFHLLDENLGIGHAQNIGVSKAIELGCEFICFFDQDSRLADNFMSNLAEAYYDLSKQGIKVGALGPLIIDDRTGKQFPFFKYSKLKREVIHPKDSVQKYIETHQLISSGTFFNINIWSSETQNHEGFFLEYVDTDWCLRLVERGFKLYGVKGACLIHKLGDDRKKLLGILEFPMHATYRYFYVFRNGIYCSLFRNFPLSWRIYNVIRLISFYVIMLLVKKDKIKLSKYVALGLNDGIKKRFTRKLF